MDQNALASEHIENQEENTTLLQNTNLDSVFDLMIHDAWSSEAFFNYVRKEIAFYDKEISSLEHKVLTLTRRLEEVEDQRDKYKKCCGEL